MPVLAAGPSAPFPLLYPPVLFFLSGRRGVPGQKQPARPARGDPAAQPVPAVVDRLPAAGSRSQPAPSDAREVVSLGLAVLLAVIVPLYAFFVLRLRFDIHNAAAVAATYGSVSAVTFMTATQAAEAAG